MISNGYTSAGSAVGRTLNVAGPWGAASGDAEPRADENARASAFLGIVRGFLGIDGGCLGIDGGCQSEQEYGSGEGLGVHFNNGRVKVRRMAAGPGNNKEWEVFFRLERKSESGDDGN